MSMDDQNFQSIIEEIWPKLKKKHLYPEIPMPKVRETPDPKQREAEEDEGVGLEMKQKQMTIRSAFVSQMKGNMSEKRIVAARPRSGSRAGPRSSGRSAARPSAKKGDGGAPRSWYYPLHLLSMGLSYPSHALCGSQEGDGR